MPTNLASTVVTLGLAFLSATCVAASTRQYSADAIAARVVDADSGAPVDGVNVVAGWEVKGGMEGGNIVGWVKVMETVTTSSPGPTPAAARASCSAEVPELTATAWETPQQAAKARSKRSTGSPRT